MTSDFMMQLMHRIDSLASALAVQVPEQPHVHGNFAQLLLGYKHGMGNNENVSPFIAINLTQRSSFQQSTHITRRGTFKTRGTSMPSYGARKCSSSCEIRAIFLGGALWLINSKRQVITELLMRYFPGITSLYGRARDFWASKGATFEFGLFCHLAINVDMGQPISSIPHRDVMNLAFGVCIIVPFGLHHMPIVIHNDIDSCILGYFPHGIMAWLVNLEAKIVIQLPPMVPYFCMSSIITHFNIDRHSKSSITAPHGSTLY